MITCWTWLDVRICGYRLVADFAHAHGSITEPRAHVHGRNRLLKWYYNHIQPRPACDQNIPDSLPPYITCKLK